MPWPLFPSLIVHGLYDSLSLITIAFAVFCFTLSLSSFPSLRLYVAPLTSRSAMHLMSSGRSLKAFW